MEVRQVRVTMPHRLVPVPMRMGLSGRIGRTVLMSMVFIMTVPMVVFQGFMKMFVLMVLGQVETHSNQHQQKRRPEKDRRMPTLTDTNPHSGTVTAFFDTRDAASKAIDGLVAAGIAVQL